ncbi:MAG: hypothetical protein UT37_C0014G0009 [Parcubacteria group bacterium GW2011_GWA2_39_18]|nr:MAG: hypothetical protein UT37_C0014G0009 [Parcubacteria group bacterium GW2011_GWA2_39_18]
METVEIYRKSAMIAEKFKENVEKELGYLQQEMESLKQWREYYESAGLQGQAILFAQKEMNLRRKQLLIKRGIPYPIITEEQWEVLCSVFDRRVPAEEFSSQSMPSEVVTAYLEAKEYKEAGIFDSIDVAYYEDDLILIGKTKCVIAGVERRYLLARWGDGLKPWEWFINHCKSRVPSLSSAITLVIASIISAAAYLLLPVLLPEYKSFQSLAFFASIVCFGFFVGLFAVRRKIKKSYSCFINTPSPFAT